MSFNKVILVGNLTRAPELKYTSGKGTPVTKTGIAVNRKATINGELREEVCFVDLTFWGRTAEIANQYLQKGSKVLIEGRLVYETWQDQNGQNRSKHSVNVDSMEMLGNKEQNQGYDNGGGFDNGGYGNSGNYGYSNGANANFGSQNANYQNGSNGGNFGGANRSYQNNHNQGTNTYNQGANQGNFQANNNANNANNFANQAPKEPELPSYDVDKDEIPF